MASTDLKKLVRDVVAAQGNAFIRELLREKGLPLSGAKGDFITRLEAAIDAGELTAPDVDEWLRRVEGWGNFHIYPRHVPAAVGRSRRWGSAELRRRLAVPDAVWDAATSQSFPADLSLTHVSLRDKTFRMTWHQRGATRTHLSELDHEETRPDGDTIEWEAYLVHPMRRVVRLQLTLEDGFGAIFVPYPLQDTQHRVALENVWNALTGVVTPGELPPFDVSSILRAADQAQLGGKGELRSKAARLTIGDGYLEVGATAGPYRDIDAIRDVRQAARGAAFAGDRATFLYAPADDRQGRDLTLKLSGRDARVWLPGNLDEGQVWTLVSHLLEFAT